MQVSVSYTALAHPSRRPDLTANARCHSTLGEEEKNILMPRETAVARKVPRLTLAYSYNRLSGGQRSRLMFNRHARLMFSRFPQPLSLVASPLCSASSSGNDVDVQDMPLGSSNLRRCAAWTAACPGAYIAWNAYLELTGLWPTDTKASICDQGLIS